MHWFVCVLYCLLSRTAAPCKRHRSVAYFTLNYKTTWTTHANCKGICVFCWFIFFSVCSLNLCSLSFYPFYDSEISHVAKNRRERESKKKSTMNTNKKFSFSEIWNALINQNHWLLPCTRCTFFELFDKAGANVFFLSFVAVSLSIPLSLFFFLFVSVYARFISIIFFFVWCCRSMCIVQLARTQRIVHISTEA